jgi:hypothetical protein
MVTPVSIILVNGHCNIVAFRRLLVCFVYLFLFSRGCFLRFYNQEGLFIVFICAVHRRVGGKGKLVL